MKELEFEKKSDSFIGGWFIDEGICDDMVKEFERDPSKQLKDMAQRDGITFRNYTRVIGTEINHDVANAYIHALRNVFRLYGEKYEWFLKFSRPWSLQLPYNIQRYEPGDSYLLWHCETLGPQPGEYLRNLAFLTYLNDIEEGGGTSFLYQGIETKAKKGLTIIFPAIWTHMHKGVPANVRKYIATGWSIFKHKVA